ncbi:MerR family transcriptional regulator [Cytophaga aurantiaca]|uniref:MerR family transcriptional regulator n=1 Tax=Cytophaga aurantiaca TaxID=29530 RepID=UPI0003811756|nr:MerR family transcriptional regulator [Cytophaga aurantiaca]
MSQYSISDLEKLSGIKAHTIRIWEQRYNLLTPLRSDGNIRSYNDDQVRRLLNVSTLIKLGIKISRIIQLTDSEINELLERSIQHAEDEDSKISVYIHKLIAAGIDYNEHEFNKVFKQATQKYGLVVCYQKVIYPILVKIGILWGKSEIIPAQEHFISNILKQKLHHAIEQLPIPPSTAETWLLFLPEEEDHEIGLLIANFLIRSSNRRVIYLGQRVPYYNLKAVIKDVEPECLQYFIVRYHSAEWLQTFINNMKKDFPGIKKYVCGASYLFEEIKLPKDHVQISDMNTFIQLLNN